MVYTGTLMIQGVLAEPSWMERMEAEDFRALTPLLYRHVNPYGTFDWIWTAACPLIPPNTSD